MPYEIELERDTERGLDRYRVTVGDRFDAADAHELSDWVSAAAQNPTAVFTIDVTRATRGSVTTLCARSAWLRARRRLEIVRRGIGARAPLAAGVLAPLL